MPVERMNVPTQGRQDVQPLIVGMGVSSGGLEGLRQFFSRMQGHRGFTFVLVQHLLPEDAPLTPEMLTRCTGMTVRLAEQNTAMEPDTLYLVPYDRTMQFTGGRLQVGASLPGHAVDVLFSSLAEELRERALVVIFSGTGSDGTGGIRAVREHGGLVFLQSPESPEADRRLGSATDDSLADFVLPPQEIAGELICMSGDPVLTVSAGIPLPVDDEDSLAHIHILLKRESGIDFTHYRRNTVLRRIQRRMMVTHCATPSAFVRLLESSRKEVELLSRDILIGVTRFFRDAEFFEKLKYAALYGIVEHSDEHEPVRVWSAGCSTGEEAYSLAILFHEVLEETHLHRDVKIFATDVDARALELAGKGVYPASIADDVSPERLSRYFTRKNGQYQISKEIRKMIIFAPHNMLTDPPFGKLSLHTPEGTVCHFPFRPEPRRLPLPRQK